MSVTAWNTLSYSYQLRADETARVRGNDRGKRVVRMGDWHQDLSSQIQLDLGPASDDLDAAYDTKASLYP